MVTRCKVFQGSISSADTKTQIGSAYTFPAGAKRIIALIVTQADEATQEPFDGYVVLEFNDLHGPFEFPFGGGGAPASSSGFQMTNPFVIPVDIPINGGATEVAVYAYSSGTPESITIGLVFE